jgi:pyrrolidone-carboxylate peptidase
VLQQSSLNSALDSVFESALLEARAFIESNRAVTDDEARALGQAAGERLRQITRESGDLGPETQLQRLERMVRQVQTLRNASHAPTTRRIFELIEQALRNAARGISSIDFTRPPAGRNIGTVNVLLTGFDPFNTSDAFQPPRPGDRNPSGAAVLALDHETFDVDNQKRVAVEGVVLPVSYEEFDTGLVETIVSQHREADAMITVSLDPRIAPDAAVDIEQFAVGAHLLRGNQLQRIPGAPGRGAGSPILETSAPVQDIATETAQPAAQNQPEVRRPTVDTAIELQFGSVANADAALQALNLPTQGQATVSIRDVAAIRRIVAGITNDNPQSPTITFSVGNQQFIATILRGPGGSFLSNEVSYRVLREIAASSGPRRPTSFHVHTQRYTQNQGEEIPQQAGAARTQALGLAARVRTTLIETLKRGIIAVARRITPSTRP